MPRHMQEGLVHISLHGNTLAEFDHHAVVRPGMSETPRWAIKAYTPPEHNFPYYITLINSKDSEQVCLTMVTNDREEKNVMVEPLGTPGSNMSQLWTFEDVDNGSGSDTHARIQSVSTPWLSAAIRGALGRIYQNQNVIGVSNQPNSESQLWKLDYTPVNQ